MIGGFAGAVITAGSLAVLDRIKADSYEAALTRGRREGHRDGFKAAVALAPDAFTRDEARNGWKAAARPPLSNTR
ncbi:MAG: hypothetical protein Q7V62_04905 [Actinomycetota bacterium]|nr:hypothetical protein [Actinomycetota bacterium]